MAAWQKIGFEMGKPVEVSTSEKFVRILHVCNFACHNFANGQKDSELRISENSEIRGIPTPST